MHAIYGMAPTTGKSVSEIATNLLVPLIGAFSSHDHPAATDHNRGTVELCHCRAGQGQGQQSPSHHCHSNAPIKVW